MAWSVRLTTGAEKEIGDLDRVIQQRIVRYLRERLATDESPRRMGKALRGEKTGLWRYRVGDYRLICQIDDNASTVLVLTLGHRSDV